MDMPKVSVIIPVYNVEQYLRNCLDSVLMQTIDNLEIVCVDDGSTDHSLSILKEYAAKDSRVRVFCQENKGAGAARNMGLSYAQGEFVSFMDGDDYYNAANILQQLYQAAKDHDYAVAAGYRSLLTEKGFHDDVYDPLYKSVQGKPEGVSLRYRDIQFDFNYQCYMFSRSLLVEHDITFPDYRRCQDPPFLVRAMIAAERFFLISQSSYTYRWGHQNIQWNKRKINDLVKAHIDLLNLSHAADLDVLHKSVASRLETRYKDTIISCLKLENTELFALLVYANSRTDFAWLEQKGMKARNTTLYESVNAAIDKMVNLVAAQAGQSEDFLKKVVVEVVGHYSAMPNADISMLNSVLLCLLSRLYDRRIPACVRKQVHRFVISPYYGQINNHCDESLKVVNSARQVLNSVILGYGFYQKLQNVREEESHLCKCVYNSTGEKIPAMSVIVPVFNVEKYISECLESLFQQTCQDIEIICVDDGSTDSSLSIVLEYAHKYPNVVVLHQKNSGLSAARNSGMLYARGEYIHFLDSDDSMKLASYELTLEKAKANDLDLLFFDGESFYEEESLKKEYTWYATGYTSKSIGDSIFDGEEYFCNVIMEKDFRVHACMYIVRREFLLQHNLRFLEGIVHEDNYFTYACAMLSKRTSHLTAPLYNRRVRRGSITIREKCFRHAYGYFHSYMALRDFVDGANIPDYIKDIASLKLIDVLKNAQYEYEKVGDETERSFYLALPTVEAERFYCMVTEPVLQLEKKKKEAEKNKKELEQAKRELEKVKKELEQTQKEFNARKMEQPKQVLQVSNVEQKLDCKKVEHGLIIRGIRCLKNHGLIYTVKLFCKKVANRLKK